ncbi:MAG: hypothetical protein KDA63_21385, partial [Planctomycetales bacterium]|nr:hypothetical protein [Planctomycetales bacterium]
MNHIDSNESAAQRGAGFSWRLIPACVVGFLGLLTAAVGVYGVGHHLWHMSKGGRSSEFLPFLAVLALGGAWLFSAAAIIRSRWILGGLIALTA